MSDPKTKIRTFIIENFLFGSADDLSDDTSFMEEGIIDSTGVLELITYVEEEFAIKVLDEELTPENLDSIEKVATYLQTKVEKLTAVAS